ncbi:MAG: outer membrane lipoprotein carrier protein LolA [Burkholderia contaminans]|uniref:Outer membrane lipoprotein carrier protein LolA n=1 Tax=Burkholderia contaminans TaxID=488447 RepID=A0AAP4VL46_9BURK|nr:MULTISPECIES: outer membrane lipoprotein carrier protein LolA [Burkholderia]MBD1412489.1 outer membrane lipoprotein carrier protein LolA [Burkholderia contaminans]MBH9671487.1 outer membrane lipoprotein carrier protein LolA [Burkholderia contaminans]MBH9678849.1 outer membrane lipoprotein carrier protein LolA [Burkholderia contaminans]MBH9708895.1 outer membrane lipoprotein carrier protein LolA [Burkholderia contaminans]MBH9720030.1 outer membrane lipoprotein carrier protein LolA [Burkholde
MTAVRRCLPTLPSALRRAVRTLAVALAATAALTALAATPARAADTAPAWNLDRLMSTLAQHKSGRATFTETKYLSIATQPVESSGELVFVAPDHLEKHTLSPKPEHLVVDGDMLTVERNNRKFTLALARYPELGAFIDSIRATLAGNRFALEQVYKVALAGRGDDWTLTLTPLDSRMLKVVSTITLDGTRDMLRSVAIRQADGDRSVMRLQPVPANPN